VFRRGMNTPKVMLPERTLPRSCSGAEANRAGREGLICRHFLGQLRTKVLPVLLPEASQYLPIEATEDADLQDD
jgi:hypothetical protein